MHETYSISLWNIINNTMEHILFNNITEHTYSIGYETKYIMHGTYSILLWNIINNCIDRTYSITVGIEHNIQ